MTSPTQRQPSRLLPAFFVAVAGSLALAATATAATVRVDEEGGVLSTLRFEAEAGETNLVSIVPDGVDGDDVRYGLRDQGSGIAAGPGCAGGGGPGETVTCLVPRSRPSGPIGVPGNAVELSFEVSDGDDGVDTTAVPANDGGGGSFSVSVAAGEGTDQVSTGAASDSVDAGPGPDQVNTGGGDDLADPGPGADLLATGGGDDRVPAAVPTPDGPDHLDLGPGFDQAVFSAALGPLELSLDGVANDGGVGEGDNLIEAEMVFGGAADDVLVGTDRGKTESPEWVECCYSEILSGGLGNDAIFGLGGRDDLLGGGYGPAGNDGSGGFVPHASAGDNLIVGGQGDDRIRSGGGADTIKAGANRDLVYMGSGDDHGTGARGRDFIVGEDGADSVRGGPGRDRVVAGWAAGSFTASSSGSQDGLRDRLDCGSEVDRAFAERRDRTRRCEHVNSEAAWPSARVSPRAP